MNNLFHLEAQAVVVVNNGQHKDRVTSKNATQNHFTTMYF